MSTKPASWPPFQSCAHPHPASWLRDFSLRLRKPASWLARGADRLREPAGWPLRWTSPTSSQPAAFDDGWRCVRRQCWLASSRSPGLPRLPGPPWPRRVALVDAHHSTAPLRVPARSQSCPHEFVSLPKIDDNPFGPWSTPSAPNLERQRSRGSRALRTHSRTVGGFHERQPDTGGSR